jgi:hypothetical protein
MRSSARAIAILIVLFVPTLSSAAGISVDAGLTPAEDRWILRGQARYMSRGEGPGAEVQQFVFPVVLAYGVRSNVSLFVRQAVVRRERTVLGNATINSGLNDTYLFAKYRAYRVNSPRVTFGVAPTLGIEFPSGQDGFTSDTWDLNAGLYASARTQTWSSDANVAYTWNDMVGDGEVTPGDELSLDAAVAYQFVIEESGRVTASPVLEVSYLKVWPARVGGSDSPNTGETVLYLSPGAKLSTPMIIVEGLVRIPVSSHLEGNQLERNFEALLGVRVLF